MKLPSMPTRYAVLVATIVASSMSYIDSTAVTVALPHIKTGLHADDAQAQWVLEGYLLFLSALMLIGGALGDRYGRRRLFALGIWIFTLSSIACAIALAPTVLVAARCVQGIGAAFMIPESLALITAVFDARERGKAMGIWTAASAITSTAGPLLGGWLTSISWRLVFAINVPLAIVVLALLYLRTPESRALHARGRLDVRGSLLVTAGLAAVVVALMQMQQRIVDASAFALLTAGAVLLAASVFAESKAEAPVLPLRLFAERAFTVANVYTLLLYAALGGALFFVPFELQHVMRYTPIDTGVALVPTIALIAFGSPFSGALCRRIGARLPLVGGAAIAALGFALFVRLHAGAPYESSILPATLVLGLGLAIAVAPLVIVVMGAADADDLGAASAINNSISRIGNLVAIAILGIVIASAGGGALPTTSHPSGFQNAMLAAAAMALAAALCATLLPAREANRSDSRPGS
jgi:EmrB/QacA subfamily drug resistance transporter